jgi:hypothetical protein
VYIITFNKNILTFASILLNKSAPAKELSQTFSESLHKKITQTGCGKGGAGFILKIS